MTYQSLDPLFSPTSIAVIGASSDPRKIGGRPIAYMLRSGYAGRILPINPKQTEIQGLPVYPSLAAVGHPVDQVIVAVSGALVESAVEEALAQQARSIVIFSSGFGEVGHEGKAKQEQLARRCAEAGVQLVGPNCIGIFSTRNAMYSTFMSALEHEMFEPGNVGIVSQSGAIGSYLYGLAGDRGVRFSHFVATGNEAGVDVAACIEWMAHDVNTKVILAYLEGCQNGYRLRQALETARRQAKPVIVMKVGSSEQGAAAAASHTGSLAGADVVFDSVFKQCGAWRAQTMEELVDVAYACSVSVLPEGNRLGVITPSGGIGVIAADECERSGLVMPHLPQALQDEIKAIVPFASGVNPVDTTGQVVSDRQLFNKIMKIVFEFDGFDSILSFNANIGKTQIEWGKVREDLLALRRQYPQKLVALSMRSAPEVVKELQDNQILYFPDTAVATRTIGALSWIAQSQRLPAVDVPARAPAAAKVQWPDANIDESQARQILEAANIPFAPQKVAENAQAAAQAATEMGFPVVMKVLSPDIAHKSDVGGVLLNLTSAQEVMEGWERMMQNVRSKYPDALLQGAVISPMITGGTETVLGMVNDPVFGPMVMFGLGGIFVEIFKDVKFHTAPLSLLQAKTMIQSIKGFPLLNGARGKKKADVECLAQALVNLSNFVFENSDDLESVEINPFIALPDGGYAVDALIIRRN